MQEKEELKQAIDEVLCIYQMVKEQEGKDWLSWTVRIPELARFSSKGSFFSASSKRTQLCVTRRRNPPIDGKVALSVCRCVGNFQNKIISFFFRWMEISVLVERLCRSPIQLTIAVPLIGNPSQFDRLRNRSTGRSDTWSLHSKHCVWFIVAGRNGTTRNTWWFWVRD